MFSKFKNLSFWNKVGALGSIASIIGLVVFFLPSTDAEKISQTAGDHSTQIVNQAKEVIIHQESSDTKSAIEDIKRKQIEEEKRTTEEKADRERKAVEEKADQEKKAACRKKAYDECLNRDPPIYGTPDQECKNTNTHYMVRRDMRRYGKEMPECYSPPQVYEDCVGKCVRKSPEIIEKYCTDEAKQKCE